MHFFGAGSATGIVGVVTHSECPWGVSNTNGWIWTTSPTNGTGSGNVGYAVAANLSPNARTGVVVIASLPFTVVQAADLLTMDAVPIESPEARALLGTDLLPFRQIKTAYVPTGLVPVLTLEAVTDDLCQQRLLKAVHTEPTCFISHGRVL